MAWCRNPDVRLYALSRRRCSEPIWLIRQAEKGERLERFGVERSREVGLEDGWEREHRGSP